MTIAQRIELRRLGYSKEEIKELAQQEQEPAQQEQEQEPAQQEPAQQEPAQQEPAQQQDPVLDAIKNLTLAIQQSNIQRAEQPGPKKETIEDIFNSMLKG